MRWLLFFSRVAFICNLIFLVSFSLLISDWLSYEEFTSTIIIIGYVFSIIFNPPICLSYLVLFWIKRSSLSVIPAWLMVMNSLFLVLQLIYLLFLNVANY